MKEIEVHPLCALVPDMAAHEYSELVESIRANGFDDTYPIVLFEGKILDGRHRYRAALDAKQTPVFVEWEPKGDDTAAKFVLRSLSRRSLTAGQRAALATDMLPHIEEEANARKKAGVNLTSTVDVRSRAPTSAEIAGKSVGVGRQSVQTAKAVKEADPETFEKLKKGKVTIAQAKSAIAKPVDTEPKTDEIEGKVGRVVTDPAIVAVFGKDEVFEDLQRRIHAIKREMLALAGTSHGRWLHDRDAEIKRECASLVKYLKESVPHAACPMGKNCGEKCKTCEGAGWVSAGRWALIPDSVKGGGS